jgi:methionyl-tRNA formyltransferase
MFGQDKIICIAGKNQCSIDFVKYISSKIPKKNILILPNKKDIGVDKWQPSLKKFAKKNHFKIIEINDLYKIINLIFISIEFESIIKTNKFVSSNLYNFHFSLLPKYRGCHTNFYQIYFGEKFSGITLHKIDDGIDTGPIIDKLKFKIKKNTNAYENYLNLMKNSLLLLKKNFKNLLINKYKIYPQSLKKGSYFSRSSVNYDKMKNFNIKKINLKEFYKIKSFIFPPLQYPIVNNKIISDIKYYKNKLKISYD